MVVGTATVRIALFYQSKNLVELLDDIFHSRSLVRLSIPTFFDLEEEESKTSDKSKAK